jgi:hypothetical protein
MLGSQAIQQYFSSGNSHYISPQVSFEWNYNLFYTPYATFSGPYTPTSISASWSGDVTTVQSGRTTSVFLPDAGQTNRSCYSFNTTNGSGTSSATITLPSSTNTYKITFWAKVDRDAQVNLSALAYIDYHRAHSSSQTIDSVMWTKFEIYLSPQPLGTSYSNPTISLHHGATDGTQTYGVLIDQLEIHQTTDFEYRYGNLWPTHEPFLAFRPGESYVPSGNSLCQLPTNFRKINTDLGFGSNWNNQTMPVSPVVYHPTLLGTNKFNPVYKNGSLSEWTRYKYFVADSATPTISALYDTTLNVNKIVIKFNLAHSKPSSFSVVLNGATNLAATGYTQHYNYSASYTNADIDASGTCILYYQADGTWKSGLNGGTWTGTVDTTSMPETPSFDFSGNIKFGGNKGGTVNATVAINSIQVTQNSATVNSAYSSYVSVDENFGTQTGSVDKTEDFKRMQVIEVSPRLEVDVSYYTMSVSTQAELDNKQNPLPISQISSNMATITLTNVPLTVSNKVLSLFSNNSTSSILKGLFRNYVKCYVNYRILDDVAGASNSDRVIPGGVFYVDTWDMNDIEKTVVTAYDISKYLQLVAPTDYVAQTEDAFRLISNILDFAGFTDYDYDSLLRITSSKLPMVDGTANSTIAPIRIRFFYCDGTQQKVFDVLREIFEAYQIAAYIDAHGVMRFLNIDAIFDPSNPISTQLHDTTNPVPVLTTNGYINNLTVYPNIVQDTYTETARTKVGQATFTYKSPQIQQSISSDARLLNDKLNVDFAPTFMDSTDVIWSSTVDEAVTYNTLARTMNPEDTFFYVPAGEATAASDATTNFRTYGIDHDGYAIIENEIVTFKYKEFGYIGDTVNTTRSVANSAEFSSTFAEISGLAKNSPFQVHATGRITQVDRGQFNTAVSSHIVMKTLSDIQQRFDISEAALNPSIITVGDINTIAVSDIPKNSNTSQIYVLDPYTINDYNTFSTKILAGPNSNTNYPTNCQYGILMCDKFGNVSVRAYIIQLINSGKPQYLLFVDQSATNSYLSGAGYVDVTDIVNSQAKYLSDSPFADYSKFINLKFVKGSGNLNNAFEVYINKTQVPLTTKPNLTLDTSGKYGVFVATNNDVTATIQFSEIYATQTALHDPGIWYHYQLPWFAEKLASNKKIFEISYMVQASPSIVGINYYDVQDQHAPSLNAYPLKLGYNWYYLTNGNAPTSTGNTTADIPVQQEIINGNVVEVPVTGSIANLPYIKVDENSLNYSPIYHSGFRSRFAIVNCSPSQVWLKKSPDTLNKINIDFSLITKALITLGDDVVEQKVFDIANINETVDITSSWVQDKNTAVAILRTIYRGLEGFSRTTTLSVYGNPLFEIGDIVVVNYALKNIVDQKYIVQGITQTFDTGLVTVLVLNQVANNSVVSPKQQYIAPLYGTTSSIATPNLTSTIPVTKPPSSPPPIIAVPPTPAVPAPSAGFSVTGVSGSTEGSFNLSWYNPPEYTAWYEVSIYADNNRHLGLSPGYDLKQFTNTSQAFTGGVGGTVYNVTVTAYNSSFDSLGSCTTTVTAATFFGYTGQNAYFPVTTTPVAGGGITLSWSNVPSAAKYLGIGITEPTGSSAKSVNLLVPPNPLPAGVNGAGPDVNAIPVGSISSMTWTSNAYSTPYQFTMIATDANANVVGFAQVLGTTGAQIVVPSATTPTITSSNITTSSFQIDWASTNASYYNVVVTDTVTQNEELNLITVATEYILSGLVSGRQYRVDVYAGNSSGISSTTTINVSTLSSSSTPTSFYVTANSGSTYGTISASWANAPTGTAWYDVSITGPNASSASPGNNINYYSNQSITFSGLIPTAGYTVTVIAYNSSAATLGSVTATATA